MSAVPSPRRVAPSELVRQLRRLERARRGEGEVVPTGIEALDALLPAGGLPSGVLVEWLSRGEGCGAATLAVLAATAPVRCGGLLIVIDDTGEFYPPAAVALGMPVERMVVVRPPDSASSLWAWEESLRCAGTVVLGRMGRQPDRVLRRLQLAAEEGGGLGLLVRPDWVRRQPSWAEVRWLVQPWTDPPSPGASCVELPGLAAGPVRCQVEVLRCRRGN